MSEILIPTRPVVDYEERADGLSVVTVNGQIVAIAPIEASTPGVVIRLIDAAIKSALDLIYGEEEE